MLRAVGCVPVGGIILWSGAANAIPSGWALCNGANGTPDLRDRFVIGAGAAYAVNAKGGAVTAATAAAENHYHVLSNAGAATLAEWQMPAHYHIDRHLATATGGGHWGYPAVDGIYSYGITTFNAGGSGAHDHYGGNTTWNGDHSHTINTMSPYHALAYIMKL